jgi:HB1, ASXL, restriction endonuclease HTH domain
MIEPPLCKETTMPPLLLLPPGTKFRLIEMEEITGTLVKASTSRALVRLDRPEREVEFIDPGTGETGAFKAPGSKITSWAATTLVRPIGFEPLENEEHDMSKTATKKPKSSKAAEPKATAANPKPAKSKSAGKLSCIDAAAQILAEKKEPMNTKEMIEAMAAKGLWSSPNGQTPAATLYSAILREIKTKGNDARFVKADRGKFEIRS